MKVKVYNSSKYEKTTVYDCARIDAMPDAEDLNSDREFWLENPSGIMLHLNTKDGSDLFVPHSFLIEITD